MYFKAVFVFLALAELSNGDIPCNKRKTPYGNACVCNSTYCDTIDTPEKLQEGQFHFYYTSSDNPGFNHKTGVFKMQAFSPHGTKIEVNASKTFQTIRGFGGTFTDSFGYAFNSLSNQTQQLLLKSFFSECGIEYTLCRVALGASDFSIRYYTYTEDYDPSLKSFNLTEDDYKYKISIIKKAISMSKRPIQLFGSTWSPPNWMKTNNHFESGYVKQKFRQIWAEYHVKILNAYKSEGIEFWGLTTGNEPITLYQIHTRLPNLVMFPEEQRDWVIESLGPALEKANYSTKIIILDDQRMYALWFLDTVMRNPRAYDYVHGIGLHWYFDNMASPKIMDIIHEKYPQQEILYTESSINPATNSKFSYRAELSEDFKANNMLTGFDPTPPNIGSWRRGTLYLRSIIENLSHWVTSYVDWNLSLDSTGGPNLANLTCDATIIIDEKNDEFYKNPMFYVMGYFSKFMPPGSKIMDVKLVNDKKFQFNPAPPSPPLFSSEPPPFRNFTGPTPFPTTPPDVKVQYIGSVNPDGSKTIIFYNPLLTPVEISITDPNRGYAFLILEPLSISSVLYS